MALDPNIILQAGRGITQFDPMGSAQQGVSLANAMMQMQQQKQAMADQADFRQQYGMSPGMAKSVHELATAKLQEQKSTHDLQKSKIEMGLALNQKQIPVFQNALKALEADPTKFQEVHQGVLADLAKNAQEYGIDTSRTDDPPAFSTPQQQAEWLKAKIEKSMTLDQQLKFQELELKKREKGFKGFHAGADQTAYQVDDATGQARQIMGPDGKPLRVPPPMTAITMQQMNSQYDGQAPLPKGMEVIAQAIAKGDQDMMTSARTMPRFADINARAAVLRDQAGQGDLLGKSAVGARAAGLKDFEGSGKAAQTIGALNTMTEHLNSAERLAQALQNGNIPMVNKISQELAKATGRPAPTDFATIKQFLAGEVAKVATGGHLTEGEIKLAAEKLNAAQSPAQLAGALATMREVAGGKLVSLNQDYKRLTGKSLEEGKRLTPATVQAFKAADAHISGGESKKAPPKPGDVVKGYVFNGGDPSKPENWKKVN